MENDTLFSNGNLLSFNNEDNEMQINKSTIVNVDLNDKNIINELHTHKDIDHHQVL